MLTKKRICILISCLALVFVSMVYVSSDMLLAEPTAAGPVVSGKVIVLDAGHGGMDGGAVGKSGILEKDLNLAITLKLRDALRAMGYRVVLTRDSDISLHDPNLSTVRSQKVADMHARLAIIEQYPQGIFLSTTRINSSSPNTMAPRFSIQRTTPTASLSPNRCKARWWKCSSRTTTGWQSRWEANLTF